MSAKGRSGIRKSRGITRKFKNESLAKGWRAQCEYCHRALPIRKQTREDDLQRNKHIKLYPDMYPPGYVSNWEQLCMEIYDDLIEDSGFCTSCEKIVDKDTLPSSIKEGCNSMKNRL
jgi:hypothetical protein